MALTSGLYGLTLEKCLENGAAINLASDTIKYQFSGNTYTPNFDTHDFIADFTDEVTGDGYTTGGEALTSVTSGISGGTYTFDAADVSLASTTLPGVYGVVVFDDTVASDPLVACVNFGASYSTSSGTFAITWNASGIFTIDYTP